MRLGVWPVYVSTGPSLQNLLKTIGWKIHIGSKNEEYTRKLQNGNSRAPEFPTATVPLLRFAAIVNVLVKKAISHTVVVIRDSLFQLDLLVGVKLIVFSITES